MKIKAVKKCNTPSHSLKVGDVVNMRKSDAEKLVEKGLAEAVPFTKEEIAEAKKRAEAKEKAE